MKHLIKLCMLVLLSNACKDKENPSRTLDMNIISPLPGSEYDKDDTVYLKAGISSNLEIEKIQLSVRKVSNDSLIFFKELHSHDKSATVSEYFINRLNPHADLVLKIQTLDHNGNETGNKTVHFHCHAH
jgi:hypothetical protein